MIDAIIKKGTTSKRLRIFVYDASKADGSGLTGLAWNSVGLKWYYLRDGDSNETQVTLATASLGTWTSGGFVEVDATNMPGWYEIGIPDAVLASGAGEVDMHLFGAANMVPKPVRIALTDADDDELLAVHEALLNKQELDRVNRQRKIYKADGSTVARTFQISTTPNGKTETPV